MADLPHKKRVRGGHRASATKMIRKAEELLAKDDPDLAQLAKIRLSLQEKVSVLKQLDSEVVDLVKEEEVAEEIEQADAYMEDVYDTMAKLDQLSKKGGAAHAPPAHPDHPIRDNKVRLPKLSIQPFRGELTSWITFWDSYEAAIEANTTLSDIDKFNYLRSLLQGPALDAVAGLTLTAANYREAIDVLKERFGNKQQIIDKHMDALLSVESVAIDTNLKALRRLYDVVEAQVRGLKSLGVASETYGSLLSSVLLSKIPKEIRLIISRKVGGGDWKLDELLKMLQDEVQARERSAANDVTPTKSHDKSKKFPPTTSTLLTGGGGSTPICYYCHQSHMSHACKNVESVEERKRMLREAGRCFVCLRRGHIVRQCTSRGRCHHCRGRHHSSICSGAKPKDTEENQATTTNLAVGLNPTATPFQPPTSTATLWTSSSQAVLLQTAQAQVCNPNDARRSKKVRIVLDSGSQRSYITEQLKMDLALQPNGEQNMSIMTFGASGEVPRKCEMVNVCMSVRGGAMKQLLLYSVPIICEPLACQPIGLCQANFKHLSGLPLADQSDGKDRIAVDILIGSDYYWSLLTGKTQRGDGGPVAIDTVLGWVLSGPVGVQKHGETATTLITHTLRVESLLRHDAQALDDRLHSFWNLESFGIANLDYSVLDEFRDKVRFVEGRYEVSLPWKDPHQLVPDNRELSLRRLHSLLRRLKQDSEVLAEYDAIIKNQIQQGIVEQIESSDRQGERVHFLPHHAVVRRDKETTKLRVVYDASAKATGPSLNECLHSGPKFDQRILDLLLRFRVHRVALIADIEKAFLMVSVAPRDRDVLRFFWIDDILKEQPEVLMFRFTRVVFGVTASPFLLNATIQHHLEGYLPSDSIEKLMKSFYVDDLVTGANDENEAYSLFLESRNVLKQGGFNLRKFRSNSAMLQVMIDQQEMPDSSSTAPKFDVDETYTGATLGPTREQCCGESKVLGVQWNVATDQLVMSLKDVASSAARLEPTKRAIVSLVGQIYDPLRLLSPIVVRFKIFLQELCESKIDWDELLKGELLVKWQHLSQSLQAGQQIFHTPRCFKGNLTITEFELCGFCDSSMKAYAAVVYLRAKTSCGYCGGFSTALDNCSQLQSHPEAAFS